MLSARTSGEAEFFVENPEIEEMVISITKCESESLPDRWGDCDKTGIKNAKHCKALGIAQFHTKSFDWMKKLANMPELDRNKTADQLTLLRWVLLKLPDDTLARHWTCYRKIYK